MFGHIITVVSTMVMGKYQDNVNFCAIDLVDRHLLTENAIKLTSPVYCEGLNSIENLSFDSEAKKFEAGSIIKWEHKLDPPDGGHHTMPEYMDVSLRCLMNDFLFSRLLAFFPPLADKINVDSRNVSSVENLSQTRFWITKDNIGVCINRLNEIYLGRQPKLPEAHRGL